MPLNSLTQIEQEKTGLSCLKRLNIKTEHNPFFPANADSVDLLMKNVWLMLQNFVFQDKEDNQNLLGQFALFYFCLHHASLMSFALTSIKFRKKIILKLHFNAS